MGPAPRGPSTGPRAPARLRPCRAPPRHQGAPPPRRSRSGAAACAGLGHGGGRQEGRVSRAGRTGRDGTAAMGRGGLSRGSGVGGGRPVSERRRVPAGTRCSRGAARSCGSSVPTSSWWRCGPACPSPRTPCSSASPWSECGHGSCPRAERWGAECRGRQGRGSCSGQTLRRAARALI